VLRVERSGTRSLKIQVWFYLFEQEARRRRRHGAAAELVVASTFQSIEAIMTARHTEAFIEQALVKVYSRGDRTIQSVAEELGMNHYTLKCWMKKKSVIKSSVSAAKEKRPQDWTAAEQLNALQETHNLTGEALQAWCREHGIFTHHLTSWKDAFCAGGKEPASSARDVRTLKDEIAKLKRDATRKDKALAEAAALLILQKKFRALWEDEGS
jgi:transposase-like protein